MANRPHRTRLPIALALLLSGPAAHAQTTVTVPSNGSLFLCGAPNPADARSCGQSFTVPTLDNVLQSFSFLSVAIQSPVTFQIVAMSGGNLVGAPLFSAAVAPTGGGGFDKEARTFVPPGGLALVSGAEYAAVFFSSSDAGVAFDANNTDAYPAGRVVACDIVGVCDPTLGGPGNPFDAAFSATFVANASPVPEPETLALLAPGLLVVGAAATRRRGGRGD